MTGCFHTTNNNFTDQCNLSCVIYIQVLEDLLEEEKLNNAPLLILANKQDLRHSAKAHEVSLIACLTIFYPLSYLSIHCFIYSSIHSSIHPSIHSFILIHSFIHLFIHSYIYLSIHFFSQVCDALGLDSLCREKKWHIQGCSASNGEGVEVRPIISCSLSSLTVVAVNSHVIIDYLYIVIN